MRLALVGSCYPYERSNLIGIVTGSSYMQHVILVYLLSSYSNLHIAIGNYFFNLKLETEFRTCLSESLIHYLLFLLDYSIRLFI